MGNKFNSMLTAAILTGVMAGQASLAEEHTQETKGAEAPAEAKPAKKKKKEKAMKCGGKHMDGKKGACGGKHEEHHGEAPAAPTPPTTPAESH